ncbi:MAG: SEL1-like repeat protein, partial [Clostridia bacterium]|nr:SEL1-like repeat protein [Clostridia bacterium]
MIFCKKCGYEGFYTSKLCPVCKEELTLDSTDIRHIKESVRQAKKAKEIETVIEGLRILADFGDTEGEREWAKLLEKGDGVSENVDEAMEFYRRAAEKFDPCSAYRYADLLSRINEDASRFWLEFSAFLEYPRAYLDAAKSYLLHGEYAIANHYSYLAAATDDTDAIIFLADRYYHGDGIEASEEYAKWYMERLNFAPLHAFRLSFKLRSVKAAEAPNISIKDKRPIANSLKGKAKRLGLSRPVFYLTSYLFDLGDSEAGVEVGEFYLHGVGCEKSVDLAIRALTRSAAMGSAKAYLALGRIYFNSEYTEPNLSLALSYFKKAGELGICEGYELLGDLYHTKSFSGFDIAKALFYYRRAAENGSENGARKADKLIAIRSEFYKRARAARNINNDDFFKYASYGAAMGHAGARFMLADAYGSGIGVKIDRHRAFTIWRDLYSDGAERAALPLGLCYAYGFGTAFNYKNALKHLTVADKCGENGAHAEVMRLLSNKKKAL